MQSLKLSVFGLAAVVFALGAVGCGKSTPTVSPGSDAGSSADMEETADIGHTDDQSHMEHADHAQPEGMQKSEGMQGDMAKMKEALAGLPAEDRTSAEKQHFCPVSGKMLGTMGVPSKVQIKDRDVWICCPGCEDQLRAKSSEYLAKLDK
jgi:hypothetical protein